MSRGNNFRSWFGPILTAIAIAVVVHLGGAAAGAQCTETVTANVVAFDQPIWANRLGTNLPGGTIFALERDVCAPATGTGSIAPSGMQLCDPGGTPGPGNVMLKPYKRPRPMVLRVNRGQCLEIHFQNWLTATANSSTANQGSPAKFSSAPANQASTRSASLHVQGLEWVGGPQDDGAWVGGNCNSNVAPTGQATPDSCQLTGVAVVTGDGQGNCASGSSLMTPGQARANRASVCSQLGTWYIARLAGGGSMDGPGYQCKIRDTDTRSLGHSLCVAPTETTSATYKLYAAHEGTFLLYSGADTFSKASGGADGGQLQTGLFGAVHVQPADAESYRSQVTATDLAAASSGTTPTGQPKIDYGAEYANTTTDTCYGLGTCRVGPVLAMVDGSQELVHSDLTAIVTGQNAGRFDGTVQEPAILESSYALPDRLQPYREFTIIYHEVFGDNQSFSTLYTNQPLKPALKSVADNFGFNYGMGGIGSEILATRLGVGPMGDCTGCKYEEFFLTSWVLGDPAMVVDVPGDNTCTGTVSTTSIDYSCDGSSNPATLSYYPDDPSNVYHSYLSDHTKFRILHGGSDLHHLHHQHAHQWMHSPDTSNGDYTDSQSIGPGSGFTLEMVYNGSGNVNQTVGDSIFHCHFYPHFAGGMWSLWRVHDVFEAGTRLDVDLNEDATGPPAAGVNRTLPDGEIAAGTPIPALVPMPTLPMAPMPALVRLAGQQVEICDATSSATTCNNPLLPQAPSGSSTATYENPGYPFFIPGVAGQRPPHPPADFAYTCSDTGEFCTPAIGSTPAEGCNSGTSCLPLDGGLPRHVLLADGETGCDASTTGTSCPTVNATDFSKTLINVPAAKLEDTGTQVEQVAMTAHAQRSNPSSTPAGDACVVNGYDPPATGDQSQCDGLSPTQCASNPNCRPADYLYNGLPPVQGAPYADPCTQYDLDGGPLTPLVERAYKAVDIQFDAVFNKEGWHFPQQRIISLWGDAVDTLDGTRAPEPLFFRANSGECIDYTLANLVPNLYELDDFQVRTPTDILGQHIHLVKFDVTSSDGAANGWNYEDGTFAPNEVTERIQAINESGGIASGICSAGVCSNNGQYCTQTSECGQQTLTASYLPFFGPGPGGEWMGAQATVQRWWADPLLDQTAQDPGVDRTLRTVFTHDHFGPSTHQQTGLYAGLVIEPPGSGWFCNDNAGTWCSQAQFQSAPFGGSAVGDLTLDGTPFGTPGREVPGYQGPAVNDGGPTSWQAVVEVADATCDNGICTNKVAYCTSDADCQEDGFREFLLEIQDSTLTWESFDSITAPDFGGWCSDNPNYSNRANFPQIYSACVNHPTAAGCCTPATAAAAADVSQCAEPSTAVCYAFGFCSTSQSDGCLPGTWQQVDDVSNCPPTNNGTSGGPPNTSNEPTCNLVAGIPGQLSNLAGSLGNLATWGTTPVDASNAQPEGITLFSGTNNFSVNYRNEPLFPRINSNNQTANAPDLSFVYASLARGSGLCSDGNGFCNTAADCASGSTCDPWTDPYPALTPGVGTGDPFTPLLRTYAGDDVQIRTLMGAHINPHNFSIQGMNWLMEPSFVDSGWRNSQVMGISEHFEMVLDVPAYAGDYLYMPGAANVEQAAGNWGLIRSYGTTRSDLRLLPQNPYPQSASAAVCSPAAVTYDVVAITAQQALGGALSYSATPSITDPNAILYYDLNNLTCSGSSFQSCTAKSPDPQPLVLRAPAGACIQVTLYNAIDPSKISLTGATNPVPPAVASQTSTAVGLRPQLVSYDVTSGSGFNVGDNPTQTVAAGAGTCATKAQAGVNCKVYTWYAGNVDPKTGNKIPIELGAANLIASDPLNHYQHGLYGALIVEPADWTWDASLTGTSAVIQRSGGSFREFVLLTPDGLGLSTGGSPPTATGTTVPPLLGSDHLNAVNYQSPMIASSNGTAVRQCASSTDHSCAVSDEACCGTITGGTCGTPCAPDPPTFTACAGDPVRFRVLHPGGINTNNTFEISGHVWSEAPYTSLGAAGCTAPTTQTNLAAAAIIDGANGCPRCINDVCEGSNPAQSCTLDRDCALTALPVCNAGVCSNNGSPCQESSDCSPSTNEWQGSRMGLGPQAHYDVVLDSAGGTNAVPGDYLFRSYPAMHFRLGLWGIFEVVAPATAPAGVCVGP